LYELLGNPTI